MPSFKQEPTYQAIEAYSRAHKLHLPDLFQADPQRQNAMQLSEGDLLLDFSRQLVDAPLLACLHDFARARAVPDFLTRMVSGEVVNPSEKRAATHTALRDPAYLKKPSSPLSACLAWASAVRSGAYRGSTGQRITDVVNIGIGGSDLGPRWVYGALSSQSDAVCRGHFLASPDPDAFDEVVARLNPESTLFIVVSKSFTTTESLSNAERAKAWLASSGCVASQHTAAVTAHADRAVAWGVDASRIFLMEESVGGRFSLWSSVGLILMMTLGEAVFLQLLAGAHSMDQHALSAPIACNIPITLALLAFYNTQLLQAQTEAVVVYRHRLRGFVPYLQQLQMESLGKRLTAFSEPCEGPTGSIVWGGEGPNTQHSFHQLLMQSDCVVPVDFIVAGFDAKPDTVVDPMAAFALAQADAMALGNKRVLDAEVFDRAPKAILGDQPCSILAIKRITPSNLGALMALYEHKVVVWGALLAVNPFDQWGVEYGKQLAQAFLREDAMMHDEGVKAVLAWLA
jgi:glucose-6-phosphate isomerase